MRKRTEAVLLMALAICWILPETNLIAQSETGMQYSQGLSRFYGGDFAGAQELFAQASQARPNDPRPLYFQGLCQLRQGNTESARSFFVKASFLENSEQGRLYNVSTALKRVQGQDRILIEQTRKAGRAAWRKLEEQKQTRTFGETVDRQKGLLSQDIRIQKEGLQGPAPTTAPGKTKGELPSFAPIRPFTERGETEVAKVPNLTDENNDEFEFFRDEIGRTSRSTAEQARLKELESRIEYANPMERPAKDGQKFVNIYDPGEIFVDEEPFFGADDPDDAYKEFENSPVASTAFLLETMIRSRGGKPTPVGTKRKGAAPGAMDGTMMSEPGMEGDPGMAEAAPMDEPMMAGGPEGEGGQKTQAKPNDTEDLFKGKGDENKYAEEEVKAPDPASSLNLFAEDLGFTAAPPVSATPGQPGMGPEGEMGPPPEGGPT